MNIATITGAEYSFQPGLYVSNNPIGMQQAIVAGSTLQAIAGFKMNCTNNASFNAFDMTFTASPYTLFKAD